MMGLLTQPLRSGVYEVADTAGLTDRLTRVGWRVARIDLASPRRVVAELGDLLDFPDYYGKNLDALNDCLGDMDRATALVVRVPDELDPYGRSLWDLLADWASARPHAVHRNSRTLRGGTVPFAVVRLSGALPLGSST